VNHAAACALWLALAGLCPALEPPHKPLPAAPAVAMRAASGPGLSLEGEYVLTVTKLPFTLTAPYDPDFGAWTYPPTWTVRKTKQTLYVTAAPEGSAAVTLDATRIDWKAQKVTSETFTLNLAVGKVTPEPGPGPGPGPVPPPPGPAPIAVDGFSVLILYESKTKSKLPRGQLAAIDGGVVRDYLQAHCAIDPDVPTWKAFRIWDPDVATGGVGKVWVDALAKGKADAAGKLPWLVVSNPKKGGGVSVPLPADEAATLEILKKYGGD
jgi:hypothetical protein